MLWLVDGYNVIRRDADLAAREAETLEAGRTALLRLLAGVARDSGERFVVVFDGARRGGGTAGEGQVQVRFSTPPERADDVLIREAARLRDGAVVVTSDRTVADAARRSGAISVSVEQFLEAASGADVGDEEPPRGGGGNPRRRSRDARAVARVLRRLGSR